MGIYRTIFICMTLAVSVRAEREKVHLAEAPQASVDAGAESRPSPEATTAAPKPAGCLATLEAHCARLYADENKGNLDLTVAGRPVPVRFGLESLSTRSYVHLAFQKAKLNSKPYLPEAMVAELVSQGYFKKLSRYLEDIQDASLSVETRRKALSVEDELSKLWQQAVNNELKRRLDALVPTEGPERRHAETRLRRELQASLYEAVWSHDAQWQAVETDFEKVMQEYRSMVDQDLRLPASVKQDWLTRLSSIKLEVPGSNPDNVNDACATEERNAYYNRVIDRVIVCAGYFTAQSMMGVIAHEVGHALGAQRSRMLFQKQSPLWERVAQLRREVCAGAAVKGCPPSWEALNQHLPAEAAKLEAFQAQLPSFLSCLQYRDIPLKTPPGDVAFAARAWAGEMIGAQSDKNLFLGLSSIVTTGEKGDQRNPSFLNPCEYADWSESSYFLSSSFTSLFFFSAAYACSDPKLSSNDRVDRSIASAKSLMTEVFKGELSMATPFQAQQALVAAGDAESPEERFADGLGYRVFARLLEKVPSIEDRRNLTLVNLSKSCQKVSLTEKFPDKAQAEKKFSLEPHSQGRQRRAEMLVPELRAVLACEKDFDIKECQL